MAGRLTFTASSSACSADSCPANPLVEFAFFSCFLRDAAGPEDVPGRDDTLEVMEGSGEGDEGALRVAARNINQVISGSGKDVARRE